MAKTVGRYSLEVMKEKRTGGYDIITVPFNINGKEVTKLPLKDIDDYTTQFPDLKTLNEKLGYKGINTIIITYMFRGSKNSLDIAYDSKRMLHNLDMVSDSSININNSYYQMMMNRFISYLDDDYFVDRALKTLRLSPKQKELIFEYGVNRNHMDSIAYEIKRESSGYKQFRDILFLIEYYEKRMATQAAIEEERKAREIDEYDDDYEPDKEAFISVEERARYNEEDPDEYNEVGLRRFTK